MASEKKKMTPEQKKEFAERMEASKAKKAAEKAAKEKEIVVKAEDVTGVDENGRETPLTELEPSLAGQEVSVPAEAVKAPEKAENAPRTYSAEEVQQMIAEGVAKALAQQQPQTIVREVSPDVEKVYLLWQADVADYNVEEFGPNGLYGSITGPSGTIMVPKNEWSRFADEKNRRHLERRWLIVLSGMTDEERVMYGCKYSDGEILDKGAFVRVLDLGEQLLTIYPKLCPSHREMVARRFVDAYYAGDARARDRELITALNRISREQYKDLPEKDMRRKGAFWPIIEGLNAEDD